MRVCLHVKEGLYDIYIKQAILSTEICAGQTQNLMDFCVNNIRVKLLACGIESTKKSPFQSRGPAYTYKGTST